MIPSKQRSRQRGFALVLTIFVIGLVLVAGMLMLSNSQFSANNAVNTEQKNQAFNAAEAGLDNAMEALDLSSLATGSSSGSLANGASYTYSITNNLNSSSPANVSGQNSIPGDSAYISSVGTGAVGGRPVTVTAVVKPTTTTISFPNDAIDAGIDVQGNWNSGNCIGFTDSGNHANVHANRNVTANACFVDGQVSASGTVSGSMNATGGSYSNTSQVPLPTSQMATYVSNAKATAQGGSSPYPDDYIASGGSLPSTYACPNGDQCMVFLDGPLSMAGHASAAFTGNVTLVINGDFSATGNAGITFQQGQKSVMVVNGNADIGGNGTADALIWAKGDLTLHGNGNLTGAAVAGGNVNLNGGGHGGGFTYDSTLQNTTLSTSGKLTVTAYGEY